MLLNKYPTTPAICNGIQGGRNWEALNIGNLNKSQSYF